jgi:hypothetical protein
MPGKLIEIEGAHSLKNPRPGVIHAPEFRVRPDGTLPRRQPKHRVRPARTAARHSLGECSSSLVRCRKHANIHLS